MTVRRNRVLHVSSSPAEVHEAVDRTLQSFREYHGGTRSGDQWQVRIRPLGWPVVVSTAVSIHVVPTNDSEVDLVLETRSQWFILGDVFKLQERYLGVLSSRISDHLDSK
jgi:hypothetical protein